MEAPELRGNRRKTAKNRGTSRNKAPPAALAAKLLILQQKSWMPDEDSNLD
ncbi:MAG TPA: hypothetical protein VF535_12525 [Allosphingosinicella sp.]